MRILHLSDTHLLAGGALHHGIVDTLAGLERVLDSMPEDATVDLVVASGDLSDDGSIESYELLRDRLEPWATARGGEVVYAMGNHDIRAGFAAVLGGDPAAPLDSVRTVCGLRVVVLDSAVPEAGYGLLRPGQLAWLREIVREPAERGTVVVLHHPPVPASTALLSALALQNPGDLLAALAGGDVRAILAGHYHHSLATLADGIPVFVAPAVANRADVLAAVGTERAVFGSGATILEVPDAGAVRAIAVQVGALRDGEQLYLLDRTAVDRIAREAGPTLDGTNASASAERIG